MKYRFEIGICQNLSKLEGKIEVYRRENGIEGLDSLPLRCITS